MKNSYCEALYKARPIWIGIALAVLTSAFILVDLDLSQRLAHERRFESQGVVAVSPQEDVVFNLTFLIPIVLFAWAACAAFQHILAVKQEADALALLQTIGMDSLLGHERDENIVLTPLQVKLFDTIVAQLALTNLHRSVLPTLNIIQQYVQRWDKFVRALANNKGPTGKQLMAMQSQKAAEFFQNIVRDIRLLANESDFTVDKKSTREEKSSRFSFREMFRCVIDDETAGDIEVARLLKMVLREVEDIYELKARLEVERAAEAECPCPQDVATGFGPVGIAPRSEGVSLVIRFVPAELENFVPSPAIREFFLKNLLFEVCMNARKSFTAQMSGEVCITVYYSEPILWFAVLDNGPAMSHSSGFLHYSLPFISENTLARSGDDGLGLYFCDRIAFLSGTEFYLLSPQVKDTQSVTSVY